MRYARASIPVLISLGLLVVLFSVFPAFADLGWNKAFVWGGTNHDLSLWHPNRALIPLSDDRFYVIYEDNFYNDGTNTFKRIWGIEGKVVQDGANYYVEWKTPEVIDSVDNAGYNIGCVAAVQSGGAIYIAYYKQVSTGTYKLMFAYRDTSGTWSTPEVVADSTSTLDNAHSPSIAIYNSTIYIAYYDDTNKLVSTSGSSGSWGTPDVIATDAVSRPSLIIRSGTPVVVYISNAGVSYAWYSAGAWSSTVATTSPNTAKFIAIALDDNNNPHVAFASSSGVFVAYSTNPTSGPYWKVLALQTGTGAGDAEWVDIYRASIGSSYRLFAFYASGSVKVSYFSPCPTDSASVATRTLFNSPATNAVVFALHDSSGSDIDHIRVHIIGTDNNNMLYWHAFNIESGTTLSPNGFYLVKNENFGKQVAGVMKDGVFHAIAVTNGAWELWYLKRDTDGYWMAEMVTYATNPTLGISLADGTPHIAWVSTSAGWANAKLFYSYRIGLNSWAGPTYITDVANPVTTSRGVAIANDSTDSDRPYIAYIDGANLYLFRKSNSGSWVDVLSGNTTPTVPLASANTDINSVAMKIVNGDLYLSYGKDSQEVHWIWRDDVSAMSNIDTQKTDTLVEYSTQPYSPVYTDIYVDSSSDRTYVVYRAGLSDLKEAKYRASTLTFEGRDVMDSQGTFAWPSALVVNNALVASYYQESQATPGDVKGLKVAYETGSYSQDEVDGVNNAAYDVGKYSQIGTDGSHLYTLYYDGTNNALKIAISNDVPSVTPSQPDYTISGDTSWTITAGGSESHQFTFTNNTSSNITVSLELSGDDEFSLSTTSISVPANDSATFSVTFASDTAGSYSATLQFTVNGTRRSDLDLNLVGTATAAGGTLTVSPTSWDFGSVQVGSSEEKTFTLSNTTDSDISVDISSSESAFTLSTNATTVPANGTATFTVTFSPTEAKGYSGTITIEGGGYTLSVAVSGTGTSGPSPTPGEVTIDVDTSKLEFGSVTVGQSKDLPRQITVNNGTSSSVNVTVTIEDTTSLASSKGDTVWSVSPASWTVDAGDEDTQTITITFTPSTAQDYSGKVTIKVTNSDDEELGSKTFYVSGTGVWKSGGGGCSAAGAGSAGLALLLLGPAALALFRRR